MNFKVNSEASSESSLESTPRKEVDKKALQSLLHQHTLHGAALEFQLAPAPPDPALLARLRALPLTAARMSELDRRVADLQRRVPRDDRRAESSANQLKERDTLFFALRPIFQEGFLQNLSSFV